jgi:hypothetical protein
MPLEDEAFRVSPATSVSTSICSCCTSPLFEEPGGQADGTPEQELHLSTALEERFLSTVKIFSSTPFCVQATAIAPQDTRVTGHWPLIELLCHRVFAVFPNQGRIRKTSTSYHEPIRPGDVLVVTATPLAQRSLQWLEATIARNDVVIATVTALCDGSPFGLFGHSGTLGHEGLVDELEKLTTSSAPENV